MDQKEYLSEQQKDTILGLIGELTWEYEHEFDWIEKSRIVDKINACNVLIDCEEMEDPFDKIFTRIMKKMDSRL